MATLQIENINEDLIKNYQIISSEEKQRIKQLIESILSQQLSKITLSKNLDKNGYPIDFFEKTFGSIPDFPECDIHAQYDIREEF